MRLFIAVGLDTETKRRLTELQDCLRSQTLKGVFTRPENFHITLVFIGEIPADRLSAVKAAFASVFNSPFRAAFGVVFNRYGCFTHSGKELWWTGADETASKPGGLAESGAAGLVKLRGDICAALDKAGVEHDRRFFRAHITLAREIRRGGPVELPPVNITVPVTRISLVESARAGSGRDSILHYTELAGYDLRNL